MSDQKPKQDTENEVLDELRNLGDNITTLLRSAWESEERKRLQNDLEAGFNELRNNLRDMANSPTGQTIREDIEEFGERIRAGEVERAVRMEVLSALRMANDGLKKAANRQQGVQDAETEVAENPADEDENG